MFAKVQLFSEIIIRLNKIISHHRNNTRMRTRISSRVNNVFHREPPQNHREPPQKCPTAWDKYVEPPQNHGEAPQNRREHSNYMGDASLFH